eukprot:8302804-Karenia_brevis.AAC.1
MGLSTRPARRSYPPASHLCMVPIDLTPAVFIPASSCPSQRSVDAPDAMASNVPVPRPHEQGVGR